MSIEMSFQINPWNVVKILHEKYSVAPYGKNTPTNANEINLANVICG